MPVFTLLSDRKITDFFLGKVRGNLIRLCPKATVIDLAHDIGAHNLRMAGFILKHSHAYFPEKTVHIIGVDGEQTDTKKHLLVHAANQYFIGADNGIFALSLKTHDVLGIYDLSTYQTKQFQDGPAMLRFSEIATNLVKHNEPESMGEKLPNFRRMINFQPIYENEYILGKIIYADSYGNIITNIERELFDYVRGNRGFTILAGAPRYPIIRLSKQYSDEDNGELVAHFNSMNLLEIGMNGGNMAELLSFDNETVIRIEFETV